MAFSNGPKDKLYTLLPVYLRERDAAEGEPLRALLRIVERQADAIEADIGQLHNDAFIETCEPWVIPYIGDLVGTTPLFDESRVRDDDTAQELFPDLEGPSLLPPLVIRNRADVAKTIYYRRRKGTLPMLEELARDVTGWAAHAVEFFELIGWTQWLRNHVRMHAVRTPDIRSIERMDRLDRAFDEIGHTVDVRPPSQFEGWHNIRHIGFFLWRLNAYRLEAVQPKRLGAAGDFRYFFSPLGNSAPLFSRLRREGDEAGLATELHVPQPLRPARFFEDLQAYHQLPLPPPPRPGFTEFYGLFNALSGFNQAPAPSLMVLVDEQPVLPERIRCRNLATWDQPSNDMVAIDVERGRLTLGPNLVPVDSIEVFYHYGFPADLGGGPYPRRAWLTRRALAQLVLEVDGSGDAGSFPTIGAALAEWVAQGRPNAIVRIRDNRSYEEAISIEPADGRFLSIEAADAFRPHVRLTAPLTITGHHPSATVTLGGLLIEGRVEIEGSLSRLRLLHTTLVPGVTIAEPDPALPPVPPVAPEPSIRAAGVDGGGHTINTELRVELAFAITGAMHLPNHAEGLFALDSIIDGVGELALTGVGAADASGPPLRLERVTVRGGLRAREITLASETIFDGRVEVERIQVGCVRFSYVMPDSHTPRRYRCQPDLAERRAIEEAEALSGPLTDPQRHAIRVRIRRRVRPAYTSEHYGQPAYLQLARSTPTEISSGAEDGSEMGTYAHLKQPQREANLRTRLEEYLPFGLAAGLIYVT
jgi:hypothetical protein